MDDLKESDYPGFFTVRSLILLIDACLYKPFFARKQNNEILGADVKSTWHNETKGVMMIDNYYKKFQQDNKNTDVVDEAELSSESEGGEYSD